MHCKSVEGKLHFSQVRKIQNSQFMCKVEFILTTGSTRGISTKHGSHCPEAARQDIMSKGVLTCKGTQGFEDHGRGQSTGPSVQK